MIHGTGFQDLRTRQEMKQKAANVKKKQNKTNNTTAQNKGKKEIYKEASKEISGFAEE